MRERGEQVYPMDARSTITIDRYTHAVGGMVVLHNYTPTDREHRFVRDSGESQISASMACLYMCSDNWF